MKRQVLLAALRSDDDCAANATMVGFSRMTTTSPFCCNPEILIAAHALDVDAAIKRSWRRANMKGQQAAPETLHVNFLWPEDGRGGGGTSK